MKKTISGFFALVWGVLLPGFAGKTMAEPVIPAYSFVSIRATTPLATEPSGTPAVFTFCRTGATNAALTIGFTIGGSATNGVDFDAVSNSITFAAGQTSSNILIVPAKEPAATGYKTVVFSLNRNSRWGSWNSPLYIMSSPSRAVAYIVYNYTNVAPTVDIVTPTNGAVYLSHPNITIAANASDSNGWVTSVEFFTNGVSVGTVSNQALGSWNQYPLVMRETRRIVSPGLPENFGNRYSILWTNVAPGDYALTAVATDNAGLQTTSAVVNVTVTTNLPEPVVKIVSPSTDTSFQDKAAINIYAAAGETNGVVDMVEFLANGTNLGVVTNYFGWPPPGQYAGRMQLLPYFFRWTNAPAGTNILTAVATDQNGSTATSAPVSIIVTTNTYRRFFPYFHY